VRRLESYGFLECLQRAGEKSDAAKMTSFQVAAIRLQVADLRPGIGDAVFCAEFGSYDVIGRPLSFSAPSQHVASCDGPKTI
jgi:hypothetical protein